MTKLLVAFSIGTGWVLVSCGPMTGPMSDSGINPIGPPGQQAGNQSSGGEELIPGEFVTARIDGTAFFTSVPEGEAVADELLAKGTSMKVIQSEIDFTRVELDSGALGYVLTALLEPEPVVIEPVAPAPPVAPKLTPSAYPSSPLYGDVTSSPPPPLPAPSRTSYSGSSKPLPPNDEDLERQQEQR